MPHLALTLARVLFFFGSYCNNRPKLGASDKPVDRWHTDTTPFDTVLFMVDDTLYEGGKFEYMQCTRESAIALLKEGIRMEGSRMPTAYSAKFIFCFPLFSSSGRVDETKIRRLPHQKVGYAIFQQGPFVMHRASTVTAGEPVVHKVYILSGFSSFYCLGAGTSR